MSSTHLVLSDDSLLSRIDRALFWLEARLTLLGGVLILALVLLATTNVLGRWVFDRPINGYIDWVEQAMAFFAFLGIAYTQRLGGHIRMDIVIARLRGRWLWGVEFLSTLLICCLRWSWPMGPGCISTAPGRLVIPRWTSTCPPGRRNW